MPTFQEDLEGRRGLWRLALHWCFAVAEGFDDADAVAFDGVIESCGGGVAPKPRDLQPRRVSCSEGNFSKGKRLARSRGVCVPLTVIFLGDDELLRCPEVASQERGLWHLVLHWCFAVGTCLRCLRSHEICNYAG